MPKVPDSVNHKFVPGLPMISQGKVRDTYALPDDTTLLPVATDRISIFDFVLNAEVLQKGEVLTALNAFWSRQLSDYGRQDIIAYGRDIDDYLPEKQRGNTDLQKRGMVVRNLNMIPVEAIVRGYLTGSGWSAYTETAPDHMICGHHIREGLKDGDCLPLPIFTPTTKATEGHDEHITREEVAARFDPHIETTALELFQLASKIALARGIILADTKLEFGRDPQNGELVLADERFTPDSSRFWLLDDWKRSREKGTSPTPFDKQFAREWGRKVGIHKLDPLRPEDVERVHGLVVPENILASTAHLYRYIFYLITGVRLEAFQRDQMGIAVTLPPVEIILGSESDIPQVEKGLDVLRENKVSFRLHIISCHRNPGALLEYAETMVPPNATLIAAAGKAAALPGVLQAWLRYHSNGHIPVLGVALAGNEYGDLAAARLSIQKLPGTPVILRSEGEAYAGAEGFMAACQDAVAKEFFVPNGTSKEAILNYISA